MPRGRGNNRGFRPGPPRGRGRGRGGGRGRGARGAFHGGPMGGMGLLGEGALVFEGDFEDFNLDHVMPRRTASPARGRGGYQTPPRGFQPRGGRGGRAMRGIGFPKAGGPQRPYISLSALERDRPLLRPMVFVRGEHVKTLFQEVEEILHAPGEEGGDIENHAPSADVVERLFKTINTNEAAEVEGISTDADKESTSTSEDDADTPSVVAETVTVESSTQITVENTIPVKETATTIIIDTVSTSHGDAVAEHVEESAPTFIIDTTPSPIVLDSHPEQSTVESSTVGPAPLGGAIVDDEVIVYVAPHPRTGRSTPAIPSPPPSAPKPLPHFPESSILPRQPTVTDRLHPATSIDETTLTLSVPVKEQEGRALRAHARTRYGLKPTPRSRKIAKKERAAARRRAEREMMFGTAGLGLGAKALGKTDPRKAERRLGDSDVEWGSEDDSGLEEIRSVLGDMDLDPELQDTAAFAKFANGVPGLGKGEVVTIADLDDSARMEEEDEEDTADEDDEIVDTEERREIGEDSDSDSSGFSEEESFQTRLVRIREKGKGKAAVDAEPSSSGDEDSDEDGIFGPDFSWADRDESFLQGIEDLLDENDDVLHGRDRKTRNKLFKAIQNGDFDYDGLNNRKKDRVIPAQLRAQWDRDRAKKAERKRQRELARVEATAEYSMRKRLGKKKKEKIFGSARFEGDTLITDRISDMAVLEQQIRTFLHDLDLKSMVLPPKGKEWRRQAHILADAFNLKSKSKGKGDGRFTTLIKTTRSGLGVNERKISRLVNGNKGEGFKTPTRAGSGRPIRNRDGEEVGKAAPKLSQTNIGFKLLRQMGWEEGDRIGGTTGGLVDPLTAIIKTTKLGLGASR